METDEAGDEQLRALTTGAGFADGLVEEDGIAHGAVDDAVEDVCEGFALRLLLDMDARSTGQFNAWVGRRDRERKGILTTRFLDFLIISLAKFRP